MLRASFRGLVIGVTALTIMPVCHGEPGGPVYQRRSSVWHGDWYAGGHPAYGGHAPTQGYFPHGQHHGQPTTAHPHPTAAHQHSSFSFQRPYPYHLDYYRMKYGGSYAPYFGNLYGPPKVYAPAYFGGQPYFGEPPYGPYDHGPPPVGFYSEPADGTAPPANGEPAPAQ